MADFNYFTQLGRVQDEDEEERGGFLFRTAPTSPYLSGARERGGGYFPDLGGGGDYLTGFGDAAGLLERVGGQSSRKQDTKRSFLDRLLAPIEAPQQTLFRFTTAIAEDGFQLGDITRALTHGNKYFNPFSNAQRIDADEVRQVFFGQDEEVPDGQKADGGFGRFVSNLAISLLYDPLLIAPLTKGLGLVTKGGRGARAVELATNPLDLAVQGVGLANREVINPALTSLIKSAGQTERVSEFSTAFKQFFVNRYAGLPDEMLTQINRLDQGINRWRAKGDQILKNAAQLGGTQAQRIMGEALQNEFIWLARQGDTGVQAAKATTKLERRVRELGISDDLFWDVYDQARKLDDEIGAGLSRGGILNSGQLTEMRGAHLRRMFLASEKPGDYIKRVEALNIPNAEKFHIGELRSRLNKLRSTLDDAVRGAAPKEAAGAQQGTLFSPAEALGVGGNQYFKDGDRVRFNVRNFTADLEDYIRTAPEASADDLFSHVQKNMLDDVAMPPSFWEEIGSHISGSYTNVPGSQAWADKLRQWHYTPGYNWKAINEKIEIVADRSQIPEAIREAMGEVLEFGPRLGAQASDAGRLLETRQFIDNIAGVVRDDTGQILSQGSRLAYTAEQAKDASGPLVELTGDHLGALSGMFVKPTVARFLQHMEGMGEVANPTRKMWGKVGDWIRKGTGHFKLFKSVIDPAAQVRNIFGNGVLMDMSGVSPFNIQRMQRSLGELRTFGDTGELGKYLQLAQDAGVTMFQHTFSRAELQQFAKGLSSVGDIARDGNATRTGMQKGLEAMRRGYGSAIETMSSAFEFSEQFFKLNVFIDKYDDMVKGALKRGVKIDNTFQLRTAEQAGVLAERALFNYSDVPIAIDFARQYGVIPFATFPFKAAPYVARTMVENPHRVLKYNRSVDQFNTWQAGSPEEAAREIAALPEYVRDRLVLRMPWRDDKGRAQYVDLSYFLPWFVIQDLVRSLKPGEGENEGVLPRDGMFTPPLLALYNGFARNEDTLGRTLVTDDMTTGEKAERMGRFLWETIVPPDMLGGSRANSIGRALQHTAQNRSDPVDWLNLVGEALSLGGQRNKVLSGSGFTPTTQAQVRPSTASRAAGIPDPVASLIGAGLGGVALSTIASDPVQQARNERSRRTEAATDIQRQIAQVRSNRNLSPQERLVRIQRLSKQLQDIRRQSSANIRDMF